MVSILASSAVDRGFYQQQKINNTSLSKLSTNSLLLGLQKTSRFTTRNFTEVTSHSPEIYNNINSGPIL